MAEIRLFFVRKKTNIFEREKAFTLFIDRLRNVALLTLVHVENFLLDAACGLLINQEIRYSGRENAKKIG